VNILSVDEVAGRAQANTQLILNRYSFVSSPKAKGPINGKSLLDEIDVRMGPLHVRDLGPTFDAIGFLVLNSLVDYRIPRSPPPDFTADPPPLSQMEFGVLGEPKFYPFDRYFLIGCASSVVLASPDKKEFFSVEDNHTEVYLRAPNFVMKGASNGSSAQRQRKPKETPGNIGRI